MLIWWMLACTDPVYGPTGQALEHYDAGRAALERGEATEAAVAFAEAQAADHEHALLPAWYAYALAQSGDVPGALKVLDTALEQFPADADMRYNRAALRSRVGMLEEAAADLRWLYANEQVDPVVVGEDPDFVALGTDPNLASLAPRPQVEARMIGEKGSILLGERYTMEMEITSRSGDPPKVSGLGRPTELLRHIRTVEDWTGVDDVWTRRRVSYEWRAVAEGAGQAGPWLVSSGGTSTVTERVKVEIVGIPGRELNESTESRPTVMSLPSAVVGRREPPWAGEIDGQSWALLPPGAEIHPETAVQGPVLELRRDGQPQWSAIGLASGESVEIRTGPRVIWPAR